MITTYVVWVEEKQICTRLDEKIAVVIAWGIHQDSGKQTLVEAFHGGAPGKIVWNSGR